MNILIVEPYFTGSHAAWALGFQKHSRHRVEVLSLPGSNWKWRMHGGAVTLARRFNASGDKPDLILATDMLDVTTFRALTAEKTAGIPVATYFHENQITYPWSPDDRDVVNNRDRHYGFINYTTALASDAVLFNSTYHMDEFLDELIPFLKHFPDHREMATIEVIRAKSACLHLGLDLHRFDAVPAAGADDGPPVVLWNHRWEYDKNPDAFFGVLDALAGKGVPFRVAVLGENFAQHPGVFEAARERLGERVVQFGYAEDFDAYARWLRAAAVLPVTSNQDFFGASVVEAAYCGCMPLLPRRLAYPEIIPDRFHDDLFYNDEADLLDRLERALRGSPAPRGLREAMALYDWSVLAGEYDARLEALLEGGPGPDKESQK
jgi:glycosyltransferase involved in cell wall biosynthesis